MKEIYAKRGFIKGKGRSFVTSIELPLIGIVAHVFYIDADRNSVNPHVYVKSTVQKFLMDRGTVELGMLQQLVRELDEVALQQDFVLGELVVVAEQGGDKFVLNTGGGGLLVYVNDHHWFDESCSVQRVCEFPNGGSKFHYVGSGAAIGVEEQFSEFEDVMVVTLDTLLHLKDACGVSVVSKELQRSASKPYPEVFNELSRLLSKQKFKTSKDLFLAAIYSKVDLSLE